MLRFVEDRFLAMSFHGLDARATPTTKVVLTGFSLEPACFPLQVPFLFGSHSR